MGIVLGSKGHQDETERLSAHSPEVVSTSRKNENHKLAKKVLAAYDPEKTIVNIGATSDGIGAVYPLARSLGFHTTGIVSVLAKEYGVSQDVDHVFFVMDTKWGGIDPETGRLSLTSQAMVAASSQVVCIGGGEVARDELEAAELKPGRDNVLFIPADMNHAKAIEKAKKKGLAPPIEFRGAADPATPDPEPDLIRPKTTN